MITYLEPGEDIETANPSRSTANASQFVSTQQRLAGAGLGLSYEVTTRDFQKSSFSAARQGMLEDRKTFEPMQEFMASHFCQVVYEAFMDAAVAAGRLRIPDYFGAREKYVRRTGSRRAGAGSTRRKKRRRTSSRCKTAA